MYIALNGQKISFFIKKSISIRDKASLFAQQTPDTIRRVDPPSGLHVARASCCMVAY